MAPGIIQRKSCMKPMQDGPSTAIDAPMIRDRPWAAGADFHRGSPRPARTPIAIDTILNQKGLEDRCLRLRGDRQKCSPRWPNVVDGAA